VADERAFGRGFRDEGLVQYLPDVPPLARAATAEDVAAGRAPFHLSGQGAPANVALPAVGKWRIQGADADGAQRVLIVQAEQDSAGKITYGLFAPHGPHSVTAGEVSDVEPLR
jgi:hypothetical protein